MKKLLALSLALLLLFGLTACAPKGEYVKERKFVESYLELMREKGIGKEAFEEYETYHAPGIFTSADTEANEFLIQLKEQPESIVDVVLAAMHENYLKNCAYQFKLAEVYKDGTLRLCYDFKVPSSAEVGPKTGELRAMEDPDFPVTGDEADTVKEEVAQIVAEADKVQQVLAFDVKEVDGKLKFTTENISEMFVNLSNNYSYEIDYEALVAGQVKDTPPPIDELMYKTEGDKPISEYKKEAGVAPREDAADDTADDSEPAEPEADVPEGRVAEAKAYFEEQMERLKALDPETLAMLAGEDVATIEMMLDMAPVMRPVFEKMYGELRYTYLGGEEISDTEVHLEYRIEAIHFDALEPYLESIPDEEVLTYVPEEGELDDWIKEHLTDEDRVVQETTVPMTWNGEHWTIGEFDLPALDE